MLGLRFFSLFTLILASLFIQKSFDVDGLLASTEQMTSAKSAPHLQVVGVVKLLASKHKSQKPFFILAGFISRSKMVSVFVENISGFETFLPKPTFENPSRAPPVA